MAKTHGRTTKAATRGKTMIDPARAELIAMKRRARTQRELARAARDLALATERAGIATYDAFAAILRRRGYEVVNAERWVELNERVREAEQRVDDLLDQLAKLRT